MEIINFGDHYSIVSEYMREMRDVNIQNDSMRFRRNIERIGEIMAYEISKKMDYNVVDTVTPLGIAKCGMISEKVVLGTIMRAGLPFHHGFLNYFDNAENAFVSAYRMYKEKQHEDFDIHIEYIASPRLDGKTLILVDPMLATGSSMELAFKALLTKGTPAKIHIASVIASKKAVDFIKSHFPDDITTVWVGDIDKKINSHSYLVPGLGDAGDLAYGEKE